MFFSYLNEPFFTFKPVGISLDCTREQIKICHNQCVYIIVARAKAHSKNLFNRPKSIDDLQNIRNCFYEYSHTTDIQGRGKFLLKMIIMLAASETTK